MTEITASKYVKSLGLPSVAYVARKVNKHPQRLFEWYDNNFDLLEAVVLGIKAKEDSEKLRMTCIQVEIDYKPLPGETITCSADGTLFKIVENHVDKRH